MLTKSVPTVLRHDLSLAFKAWALPAVLMFAGLAVANRASAGAFAATYFNPSSQTVNTGSSANVDLIFGVGTYSTYGIETWINFDPLILQVSSLTNGGSSPFSTVDINTFDNILGTIHFKATGGTVVNSTLTAASIGFTTIGPGTSAIDIQNVIQFISNYGPYGVNGLAVDGSVTAVGASNVPDNSHTLILLGSALLPLGMLRRRLVRARKNGCQ